MKITLEELLAFTTVVDSGSITAAAEQLGQTTSGISRALSRLEKKLDTTLMRRTTRRLELTEEGQSFLSHAREIINSVENAEEQMALRRLIPAGRLRVNAAAPFMEHVIVPLVAGFRQSYPQIELELNTDNLIIDLLEKRTDIAIHRCAAGFDHSCAPAGCQPLTYSRQPALPRTSRHTGQRRSAARSQPAGLHSTGVTQSVAAALSAGTALCYHADNNGIQR